MHTLTINEMPAHRHDIRGNTAVGNFAEGVAFNNTASPPSTSTAAANLTGGGAAHNNLQPYLATNHIIKT